MRRLLHGFLRPPGWIFYGAILLASAPIFLPFGWIVSTNATIVDLLFRSWVCPRLVIGGYWFIAGL